jgi:hypothetical protein
MTHPKITDLESAPTLQRAVEEFLEAEQFAREWASYPYVNPEIEPIDTPLITVGVSMPLSEEMSSMFAKFLVEQGFLADVIEADEGAQSTAHHWVRVRVGGSDINIDWTARQYHLIVWPPEPQYQSLPTPMIWYGSGPEHPIVSFKRQTVVPSSAMKLEVEEQLEITTALSF